MSSECEWDRFQNVVVLVTAIPAEVFRSGIVEFLTVNQIRQQELAAAVQVESLHTFGLFATIVRKLCSIRSVASPGSLTD